MFSLLTEALKKQIYSYLAIGDFIAAKELYDKWRQSHASSVPAIS